MGFSSPKRLGAGMESGGPVQQVSITRLHWLTTEGCLYVFMWIPLKSVRALEKLSHSSFCFQSVDGKVILV